MKEKADVWMGGVEYDLFFLEKRVENDRRRKRKKDEQGPSVFTSTYPNGDLTPTHDADLLAS